MDETHVLAGWARSRIWAAQESAALYGVFLIVSVLQYRYQYCSPGTYIAVPVPIAPVPIAQARAASAVGCDSVFTRFLFLPFILTYHFRMLNLVLTLPHGIFLYSSTYIYRVLNLVLSVRS